MSKLSSIFFFATLFCLIDSCKLPYDDVDLNVKLTPEYAVPLVETTMNLKDLFEGFDGNAYLQVQSDGTYKMIYKSPGTETLPLNLFANMPLVQTIPITQSDIALPFPTPSGMRIDVIDFKKGFFKWRFNAQSTPLTVRISLPQFTKNGQAFSKIFTLTNVALRDSIDLNGWHCEPTMGNIVISYQANKTNGEFVSLNNQGFYEITRFESKTMKGYFGQFLLVLPKDSIRFDFFKNWKPNGKIRFSEPKFILDFDNSFGFPLQLRYTSAESNNLAGQKVSLQSPLTTGVNLSFPTLNEIGLSKKTSLAVDSKNSNLTDVISSYPTMFSHTIIGITNLGNTTKNTGFLNDDSRLKTSLSVEIPLIGTAENFTAFDTLALDLSKFSEVAAAEFKITTDNEMPIDMTIQGYFVSSTGAIIDSLVQKEPLILRGAPTTAAGTTIGTSLAYNFIKVDATKFTRIRSSKKIIMKYSVSSTNNGANSVRINSSQKFGVKLGVRVGVNL
jgi:hypothetical protein